MARVAAAAAAAALVLLCCAAAAAAAPHSDKYFAMVDDVVTGRDYYALLNVSRSAGVADVKRAYRKMSLQYHPDKTVEVEHHKLFLDLTRAMEVLVDEDMRREYDSLLDYGVPWADRYYGRHAARVGAPVTDLRWVLFWFITVVTVLKHWYQNHRYSTLQRLVRESQRYKQKQRMADDDEEVEVKIVGRDKPTLRDLFVVQLVLLPYTIVQAVRERMRVKSPEERRAELMQHLKMTPDEFEEHEKAQQRRVARMLESNKYKRYMRAQKKAKNAQS